MQTIDELIKKGLENLSREELIYLGGGLIEEVSRSREEVSRSLKKISRARIRDEVFHKSLDNFDLQERCQLIVDGLGDVIGKGIGEDFEFKFDAVGVYLPKKNKDLELAASSGEFKDSLRKVIPSDDFVASFKERLKFSGKDEEYEEIILPLVAKKMYQGTIFISNKKSGRAIPFGRLHRFFRIYTDSASGAVFGGIDRKKILEEQDKLFRLNRDFQNMAATTEHEIRNALGSINGAGNLALEALSKSESDQSESGATNKHLNKYLKKFLSIIVRVSKDTGEEVGNLTDFARLQSEYKPRFMAYQWNKCLTENIEELTIRADEKNAKFVTNLSPLTNEIYTDPKLTNKAQLNVLRNSVCHLKPNIKTKEPSIIEVSTGRVENKVYLRVTNEGFIPDLKKIFVPFYTTLDKGGTGLGLSIVKGNVELLGGEVKVENIMEDKQKVRFIIYLPQ